MENNEELKPVYESMHAQGVSSWFSDGTEERETILKMGEPWKGRVLEIGCGEGELCGRMIKAGSDLVLGIDYSQEAINKAHINTVGIWDTEPDHYTHLYFKCLDYKDPELKVKNYTRIVMQGVLEHLDNPFVELRWMIDNLLVKGGDVITSSPCFLNPRGIVWMTLNMLGAVMSKTDLHYLGPGEFEDFCKEHGYRIELRDCDDSWGNSGDMIKDLRQRIPLALRDGNLPCDPARVESFLAWLEKYHCYNFGATVVYRITA